MLSNYQKVKQMAQAKIGDKVVVSYVGTLDDGEVFDSSLEPIEFEIGEKAMLPAFENAVAGMSVGNTRTTTIPPEDAYGEYEEGLTFTLDRSEFPPDIKPRVGKEIQGRSDEGNVIDAFISDVSDDKITMNANHPLAGKKLTFKITLINIL
jgi:FKBP-type peptidyl-prolyl cis-trans isomerases 2